MRRCPSCGEYRCPGNCRGLEVVWGCYGDPYVYADSLGPGGATGRRYAQTTNDGGLPMAGTHWHDDMGGLRGMGDCSRIGHGDGLGRMMLGQIDDDDIPPGGVEDQPQQCPPGWPPWIPCIVPSEFPPGFPGGQPGLPGGQIPPGFPVPQPGQIPSVVVSEEEARRREENAFKRGEAAERNKLIMYTGISAVVSGLVGIALGRVFGA